MSLGSPAAFLLWSILSCLFLVFLLVHLWLYDRFQCLRWNSGRQPGTFRRVMTYSYLATVPLLTVFSVSMTAITYKEGSVFISPDKIVPKPVVLWDPHNRRLVLPLTLVFSIAWGLEMVTHLEELAFWLFLLNQGPNKRDWFLSWEYRTWCIGSVISIVGLPLTAVVSRHSLDKSLLWIFLVGSSASTCTTICFLYVLARFPAFLKEVKTGGAGPDVVLRLTTSYHLNIIRVIFRFLFTVPPLIIALDFLNGRHAIITAKFWPDFFFMISAVGCLVSSTITLLIFFPYSSQDTSTLKEIRVPTPISIKSAPDSANYRQQHNYYHAHDHLPSASFKTPTATDSRPPSGSAWHAFRFPSPSAHDGARGGVRDGEDDDDYYASEPESIPYHDQLQTQNGHQPPPRPMVRRTHPPEAPGDHRDAVLNARRHRLAETPSPSGDDGGRPRDHHLHPELQPQQPQPHAVLAVGAFPHHRRSRYAVSISRPQAATQQDGLPEAHSLSGLHPYVISFRSPIDLPHEGNVTGAFT